MMTPSLAAVFILALAFVLPRRGGQEEAFFVGVRNKIFAVLSSIELADPERDFNWRVRSQNTVMRQYA